MKEDMMNCSTIIIGKKASKTGKVLIAHNEDDPNELIQSHLVPRKTHEKGEVITSPDGDAVIPQVKETYSYYWSEARAIGGEAFADSYLNEWGVLLVSNGCVDSKVPEDGQFDGGMGYVFRRLVIERSKSARQAVEVAGELVEKYGYRSTRSYAFVDKNEAWLFQVGKGHVYAAQRVEDDEILYIPNWLTIHQIDFNDTKHKKFYWAKNLVSYAIDNHWYKPKKKDYSDFDFANTYQAGGYDIPSNRLRSDLAWKKLTGKKIPYRTFSIKAPKKYGVEDLKPIMRSHYEGHQEDLKKDPTMSPHRFGICRDTTMESLIVEFNEIPELICMWRAFPRPCVSPYVPWYLGITDLPKGHEWMNEETALASHFAVGEDEFAYHSGRVVSTMTLLMNLMEFHYQYGQDRLHQEIEALEAEWTKTKKAMDQAYMELVNVNKDYACAILTDYTSAQSYKVWSWARELTLQLVNQKNKDNMQFWRSKL